MTRPFHYDVVTRIPPTNGCDVRWCWQNIDTHLWDYRYDPDDQLYHFMFDREVHAIEFKLRFGRKTSHTE